MQGLEITTLTPRRDERGETFEVFKGLPGKQVTVYQRKQGASFANHFHTGSDPSKNPELFFLISGQAELSAHNGKSGEQFNGTLGPGMLVAISPGVYHSFRALTDVNFIEYRSTIFDPEHPDCLPESEYISYLQS